MASGDYVKILAWVSGSFITSVNFYPVWNLSYHDLWYFELVVNVDIDSVNKFF